MFKWYITENFSLKFLKIAVLRYGSLLYASRHDAWVLVFVLALLVPAFPLFWRAFGVADSLKR